MSWKPWREIMIWLSVLCTQIQWAGCPCIWPYNFTVGPLCWWQKGWLAEGSGIVQSSRWIKLWLGCNSQPTKQTTSLCGFIQGQDYSLKKTSHAWVRQPNTIVVQTLWPLRGHGHCSSHCFVISPGKGFPWLSRSTCLLLSQPLEIHKLCPLCYVNGYHLQFLIPVQQFLKANHIFHLTWLRAYMMFPHFSACYSILTISFITYNQQALCGHAAENAHWWLLNSLQSPAPTLWYSDLIGLRGMGDRNLDQKKHLRLF